MAHRRLLTPILMTLMLLFINAPTKAQGVTVANSCTTRTFSAPTLPTNEIWSSPVYFKSAGCQYIRVTLLGPTTVKIRVHYMTNQGAKYTAWQDVKVGGEVSLMGSSSIPSGSAFRLQMFHQFPSAWMRGQFIH